MWEPLGGYSIHYEGECTCIKRPFWVSNKAWSIKRSHTVYVGLYKRLHNIYVSKISDICSLFTKTNHCKATFKIGLIYMYKLFPSGLTGF